MVILTVLLMILPCGTGNLPKPPERLPTVRPSPLNNIG
jgi:hypothetical protein